MQTVFPSLYFLMNKPPLPQMSCMSYPLRFTAHVEKSGVDRINVLCHVIIWPQYLGSIFTQAEWVLVLLRRCGGILTAIYIYFGYYCFHYHNHRSSIFCLPISVCLILHCTHGIHPHLHPPSQYFIPQYVIRYW